MALPTRNRLTVTTAVEVYVVPPGNSAAVTVNVAAFLACEVKLAITAGAAPVDADWFEAGQALPVGAVLERTGIVLPAAHKIYAQTTVANAASVQVWGIEEAA